MEASWFVLLVSAAILLAMVLLAVVCLNCRKKSPLASISQTAASEEYVPSSGFIVIHPCQPRPDQNTICSPSSLMPRSNLADRGSERGLRPYTPTETESNPSYENPVPGTDFPDSDAEENGNGYIEVLPDKEPSRASTPDHNYENVEKPLKAELTADPEGEQNSEPNSEPDSDSEAESEPNYLNVEDLDRASDQDDDDEENYVNQPPMSRC